MSVIESAIGWLAPPQCIGCGREGESICLACSASEVIAYGERCWNCAAMSRGGRTCPGCRRLGGPRYVWVTSDYDGLTKNLIHTYKFSQQRAAAQSIARLMLETLKDFNSDETISKLGYLLVPVPTASSRARQRGFDHSILLARKLSALNGLSFERALIRLGSTRQLGAPRHIRQRQLTGSFAVRQRNKIAGRNVLLIDDVLTTGGTLIAAAKSLRKSGARRVDALVFAKRL